MNEAKTLVKFTEKQEQFIRFLGRNKKDVNGNKYTNEEFAKLIGVHYTTLYDWKQLPGFSQAVFDYSIRELAEHIPGLNEAVMMKAAGIEPKKRKSADIPAYLALMRQASLLKSDKSDINQNMSGELGITIQTVDYKNANDNSTV